MITKVIVTISHTNIEGDTTIEFSQVGINITAILDDEVNNIKITIACISIAPICQAKHRQSNRRCLYQVLYIADLDSC